MVKVLFVCLGNICRSPTAEGVFTKLVNDKELADKISIDSAGTGDYHIGKSPDLRAQEAALKRGINIDHLAARQVSPNDFEKFDYIVAMDKSNYANLQIVCPAEHKQKLHLFLQFAPELETEEVPDPYFGGKSGFEHVLNLVETASERLLTHIQQHHF